MVIRPWNTEAQQAESEAVQQRLTDLIGEERLRFEAWSVTAKMALTVSEGSPPNSEIWGTRHDWKSDITDHFEGGMGTRYFCRVCGHCFVHRYQVIPDIYTAMVAEMVPAQCVT